MKRTSIDYVKRACERGESRYWFSKDTLRFFASRVSDDAYLTADGKFAYFVSSERNTFSRQPRLYSVRVCNMETGSISTVGEFQAYASRNGALAAVKRCATKGF